MKIIILIVILHLCTSIRRRPKFNIDKNSEVDKLLESLYNYLEKFTNTISEKNDLKLIMNALWNKRKNDVIDMKFVAISTYFYIEKIKRHIIKPLK